MYLSVIYFLIAYTIVSNPKPVVRVSEGLVEGTWQKSTKGRTYASFRSIPFAAPPIGENRFKDPQPLQSWGGVWDAKEYRQPCIQYHITNGILGSEDCLYLNVHTPRISSNASLPVMVYIHGGGFMMGSGNTYDPTHLMDWDMVVVTINYRLGVLGFLSTSDNESPGNVGLKDQVSVLQWVKKNIRYFGGDPENVTLFGQSAGAACVHYHYLSPLSRGTFVRGIAYSGSAFAPWAQQSNPLTKAKMIAAVLSCPNVTSQDMIKCLKHVSAADLVNAQISVLDWKMRVISPFAPTIESPDGINPFLTQCPYRATLTGNMVKLPILLSVTSQEGCSEAAMYKANSELLVDLKNKWETLASIIFRYNDKLPIDLQTAAADRIKQFYFKGKSFGMDTLADLTEALTDRNFKSSSAELAQVFSNSSGQPVYFYEFAFRGESSLTNLITHDKVNYGVSHADDIYHVFKSSYLKFESPDDVEIRTILIDIIYSYMTKGVPKLPHDMIWHAVTPEASELNYVKISSPSQIEEKTSTDYGHKSFWDSFGFDKYKNCNIKG